MYIELLKGMYTKDHDIIRGLLEKVSEIKKVPIAFGIKVISIAL